MSHQPRLEEVRKVAALNRRINGKENGKTLRKDSLTAVLTANIFTSVVLVPHSRFSQEERTNSAVIFAWFGNRRLIFPFLLKV